MASGKKAAAAAAKPAPTRNALESDSDSEQITEIKVNQKFAKEYTDRKRKEELTKLERQRAYLEEESDEDESESETEDEDAEELTREVDNDIKKTLRLIRNRDPIIYDSSVTFFKARESDDSGSDSEGDTPKKSKKSEKKKDAPLYYKDLVRQQVIAGDVDSEEEDDESSRVMTYGEEQAKLKQDFLKSLKQAENENSDDGTGKQNGEDKDDGDGSDLEGGLFSVRTKTDAEQQLDDDEYEQFKSKYGTKLKKDTIDPEAFLENYLNGGWKEKKDLIPHYEDIVKEDEEDAEALEKMEEFEHAYNFRFEEEGSGLIQTYARNIEDSMRRKDDSRKQKREERKARKALERLKKEEELRRLKNLKQAEIQSKLEKIAKLVGKVSEQDRLQKVLAADLDGDFDPEEYDTRMQQLFDDEYYNENEDDGEAMEKPTWDDEEDKALFAGLPVEDEEEEDEEEEEVKPVIIEEEEEGDEEEDDGEEEMEEDAEDEKNMTPEELERAKQKYLDELYGLDYEDLIGDLQCRFKYREVRKNDFGLTADEIMAADDKDLKSLVSLKRLAPYLEEEYAVNRKKVKSFRKSLEEKQAEAAAAKKKKKSKEVEASDGEENETAADAVVPTKKRKRTKKNKQTANAVSEPEESTLQGDDGNEEPAEDEGTPAATHESIPTDETKAKKKKKQRRSKKKKDEPNPFASTGLSSSRLESYKLLKSKK